MIETVGSSEKHPCLHLLSASDKFQLTNSKAYTVINVFKSITVQELYGHWLSLDSQKCSVISFIFTKVG
jgi:hypothetical protein